MIYLLHIHDADVDGGVDKYSVHAKQIEAFAAARIWINQEFMLRPMQQWASEQLIANNFFQAQPGRYCRVVELPPLTIQGQK